MSTPQRLLALVDTPAHPHEPSPRLAAILGRLSVLIRLTPVGNPASFCKRLSTQPGRENVPCRVDVAIVRRPTTGTYPLPYSKICDTFRPRRREIPACWPCSGAFLGKSTSSRRTQTLPSVYGQAENWKRPRHKEPHAHARASSRACEGDTFARSQSCRAAPALALSS